MCLQPEGGVNAPNVCGRLFKNQNRTRKFQLLACNTANFHLNPIPSKCRASVADINTDTEGYYGHSFYH